MTPHVPAQPLPGGGLATAAAAPPSPLSNLPSEPQVMALQLAQLAGELFAGTSVVPAPTTSAALTETPTIASPGVTPTANDVPAPMPAAPFAMPLALDQVGFSPAP